MDDFEKAILFSFEQSGNFDAQLRAQAMAYCEQAKQSPTILQACLEKFRVSQFAEVQFWCLQTLEELIRLRYSHLNVQERSFLQASLLAAVCTDEETNQSGINTGRPRPAFVRNKLAQVVVILIYIDYPSGWPSVFLELLNHLGKGPAVVDMFCRVLNTLDEEVISLDYPRKPNEIVVSTRIKDAMRQQCVPQIVRACYDLVVLYKEIRPVLAASVLVALQRYVTWIDIALVANDTFIPLLLDFLVSSGVPPELRGASADCLLSIVLKRMDASSKLALLQRLQIGQLCGHIVENQDPIFAPKLITLLTGFASEILESSKKLISGQAANPTSPLTGLAGELFDAVLPSIFYFMEQGDEEVSSIAFQFLSSYVAGIKTTGLFNEKQAIHVRQILEAILSRMQYNPADKDSLDVPDKVGKEVEDTMVEYRRDLFVLFRNIHRITPELTKSFVKNNLITVLSNLEASFEKVEAAITLLYVLGEGVTEEALKSDGGSIEEMAGMLLSVQVSCHSHRLVALIYLETITRYVHFVQQYPEYIPAMLAIFLDKRGIHHSNPNVSRRASYLFMRLVKTLRVQLLPFIEDILQSLQAFLLNFTTIKPSKRIEILASEHASQIFEAIGLLIGMEDLSAEKQMQFLSAILVPLCNQVETLLANEHIQEDINVHAKTVSFLQQVISAISSLSKGFGAQLAINNRPAIGMMFKQTMDILLRVLLAFPKTKVLRSKVISFLHRMVETLGNAVFPFLPTAIEQLLAESEPKEMVEFLLLINQLLNKFKLDMKEILQKMFPFVVSRIFAILPKALLPEGPGINTEEIRELRELQRVYFTFLHAITSNELSSVFLAPESNSLVNDVIHSILDTACNHKDMLVRKLCVQVFIKLIKDWCGCDEKTKVDGFRHFILETFAPKCCIYSVLDQSFDLRDANTFSLFGEIVTAQKVIYEKCGDSFLIHQATKVLPAAHCPPNLAEQYCLQIQQSDLKGFKSFYKSLVERLKSQQNGSLSSR